MPSWSLSRGRQHSAAESKPFDYSPLSEARSCIRLLKIQSDKDNDDVVCELWTCDLTEAPPYNAVSYTWGQPTLSHHIVVNGAKVPVRRNCHFALWQIRRQVRRQARRYLRLRHPQPMFSLYYWLDALCIDQMNLTEKSHQVQMMGIIFRRAEKVVVSLGSESVPHTFFEALRYAPKPSYGTEWRNWLTLLLNRPPHQEGPMNGIRDSARDSIALWSGLHTLSKTPYWSRVWIVQELAVARSILLLCGGFRIDWDLLSQLASGVSTSISQHIDKSTVYSRLEELANTPFYKIQELFDSKDQRDIRLGIPDLWQYFSNQECCNPLDRVYGFLSLLPTGTSSTPQSPIVPDYTKSTFDLAMECLDHSIDILNGSDIVFLTTRLLSYLQVEVANANPSSITRSRKTHSKRETLFEAEQSLDIAAKSSNEWAMTVPSQLMKEPLDEGFTRRYCTYERFASDCIQIQQGDKGGLTGSCTLRKTSYQSSRQAPRFWKAPLVPKGIQNIHNQLTPRSLEYSGRIVAYLCSRTAPGDYLVPLHRLVNYRDQMASPSLVVRHSHDEIYEIIGQALVSTSLVQCSGGQKCECSGVAHQARPTVDFEVHLSKEDLVLLAAQDVVVDEASGSSSPEPSWDPRLQLQRLYTSPTTTQFSSFVVGRSPRSPKYPRRASGLHESLRLRTT